MARSKAFAARCVDCQRRRTEGEKFSYRGLCAECTIANVEAQWSSADRQLADPDYFQSWRRGMAASVGLTLPDREVP